MTTFRLSILLVCLSFLGTTIAAQDDSVDDIDAFMENQLVTQRIPGMALVIAYADGTTDLRTYGDDGASNAVTAETLFRIGSLSKSMTAVATLQLVEDGSLSLDDTVKQYIPDFATTHADSGTDITIRQLLNHTSGLTDRSFVADTEQNPSLASLTADLGQTSLTSSPNTTFAYFNHNYDLLGRIIEVVSGQSYADYMASAVFEPLRMRHALASGVSSTDNVPQLTQGHILLYGFPLAYEENLNVYAPSGGVLASASDIANYMSLFVSDKASVLGEESVELMFSPPDSLDSNYGMGWFKRTLPDGSPVYHHSGDLQTARADMMLLPDDEIAFAVLYNRQNLFSSFTTYPEINNGIAAILRGQKPNTGLSASVLGIIILFVSVLIVFNDVRRLLQHPKWLQQMRGKSVLAQGMSLLAPLFPVVIFLFLPQIIRSVAGRAIDYDTLIAYIPDIMLLLLITAIVGGITALMRIVAIIQGTAAAERK